MAIALDSAPTGITDVALTNTITRSHTCTGSNLILFAAFEAFTQSDVMTGATYNGVAMTRINYIGITGGGAQSSYLYYILNPATGANNIVGSASSVTLFRAYGASYTGVQQSGQPDGQNTATGTATSASLSITTTADNCWMVLLNTNDTGEPTAGTNSTRRTSTGGSGFGFFDSNGAITPPQAFSMGWSLTGTPKWTVNGASFSPSGGVVAHNLSVLGVGA